MSLLASLVTGGTERRRGDQHDFKGVYVFVIRLFLQKAKEKSIHLFFGIHEQTDPVELGTIHWIFGVFVVVIL